MSVNKSFRIKAPIENKDTGKTVWCEIGMLWARDDGTLSGSINAIPTSPNWDGKINLFKVEGQQGGGQQRQARQQQPRQQQAEPQVEEDEIPF